MVSRILQPNSSLQMNPMVLDTTADDLANLVNEKGEREPKQDSCVSYIHGDQS